MPRSKIFLAAAFILAIFAVSVIWQPEDSDPVESNAVEKPVASQPEQASPVEASLNEGRSKATENAANAHDNQPSAGLPIEPAYQGADVVLVSGIDMRNDQSIAGADVYVMSRFDLYSYRNKTKLDSDDRHTLFILREHGKRYRSGEDGFAHIPPPSIPSVVAIEKDEMLGVGHGLDLGLKEFSLPVRPRQPLVARVKDQNGTPVAGVPVAIRYSYYSSRYTAATRRTNADGDARFYSISMLTQAQGGPPKFSARLEIPGGAVVEGVEQEIDLSEEVLTNGSVDFTLPSTGGARVSVLDLEGNPFGGDGVVTIDVKNPKGGRGGSHSIQKNIQNGTAEFPFIGLGVELEAKFRAAESRNDDFHTFHSPSQAGEWVDATMQISKWPVFTGTLLGPDQKPLGKRALTLEFTLKEDGQYRDIKVMGMTEVHGKFRFEPYGGNDLLATKSWKCKLSARTLEGIPCHGEASSSTPIQRGENRMGEIQLVQTRKLLAGRVIDTQGNAVPGAELTLSGPGTNASGGTITFSGKRQPKLPTIETKTNQHGEFTLYGEVPEADGYKVIIKAIGFQESKHDVALGMEDVDLVLDQAGVIIGTVLLDKGVPHHRMSFRLSSVGTKNANFTLTPTADETKFDMRAEVEVGKAYRLVVKPWSVPEVYVLEDLAVLPGEELRPPQLQPLDLRGKLLPIHIAAQDQHGNALSGEFRILRDRGSSGSSFDEEGTTIIGPAGGIDRLQIIVKGYKTVELQNVTSDQLVTLEDSIQFQLRVPASLAHYRGRKLSFSLLDEQESNYVANGQFDRQGRAKVFVPQVGNYRLRLSLLTQSDSFGFNSPYGETQSISVQTPGQEVFVEIDQAELDAANDKLDED